VPTVTGASRADVARGLGFLHAQDRFFQMDLLRRRAAGELAEIFSTAAVPLDQAARIHGFRTVAQQVVARATPAERAVLDAYVAGVNAGLAALRATPWEYLVLRTPPAPWRSEDSVLVTFAMWLDLQDSRAHYEQSLRALQFSLGTAALNFFAPLGSTWDAPLDGSTLPPAPIPAVKLEAPADDMKSAAAPVAVPEPLFAGSNSFAVAGALTRDGAALVANDMHLALNVPHIWYRASLAWTDAAGPHRLSGLTLPGVPNLITGSNGAIAWGFTNSQIDTVDVVIAQADNLAQVKYRTARGWIDIAERTETIRVKNAAPVSLAVRSTEWGPIIGARDRDNCYPVLRWTAHDPAATDFGLFALETATSVEAALALAHRCGMPNQNLLVADTTGAIAWTVTGKIPRRVGYDGRLPVSWAWGDRHWDGWIPPEQVPVVRTPPDGILWTANNRIVGGGALNLLGDGSYDPGARARQIRDDLRTLAASGKKIAAADLLGVQLDHRAVFLERWQQLLAATLTDAAAAKRPRRAELRDVVRRWTGEAAIDSAAYRVVRAWRLRVAELVFAPVFEQAQARYPGFSFTRLHFEDPLWRLLTERPPRLLNPRFPSWDAVLLAAADDVLKEIDKANVLPSRFTWGARNTLKMQHPFSRFLPAVLARRLDMPAEPLPGDSHLPRVQSPTFGASARMVVAPGREADGLLHLPGGQSAHPLSPYYRAGHDAWARGEPTPFLPGPTRHTLVLKP
jgi:penicillin amidase